MSTGTEGFTTVAESGSLLMFSCTLFFIYLMGGVEKGTYFSYLTSCLRVWRWWPAIIPSFSCHICARSRKGTPDFTWSAGGRKKKIILKSLFKSFILGYRLICNAISSSERLNFCRFLSLWSWCLAVGLSAHTKRWSTCLCSSLRAHKTVNSH